MQERGKKDLTCDQRKELKRVYERDGLEIRRLTT